MPLNLKKPIPPQIVNEGATYGPLQLTDFIESTGGKINFRAELTNGQPLTKGLICTTDGVINGIPATGTHGVYQVTIFAVNAEAEEFTTQIDLTIKPRIEMEDDQNNLFRKLKSEIWEALGQNLPLPELTEILNRPITAIEIYYLLQRFATLTIWDVYNLDYPGEKQALNLEGISKHYQVYDRGCCIVGTPKQLFSHERTLEDALQTARVMAREVYKRGWVIEFAGFDKMVRAAWVELQLLGDKHNKQLEVLHFSPSNRDVQIYKSQVKDLGIDEAPTQEI